MSPMAMQLIYLSYQHTTLHFVFVHVLFIVILHEDESVYLIITSSIGVPEHLYIQIHILLKNYSPSLFPL